MKTASIMLATASLLLTSVEATAALPASSEASAALAEMTPADRAKVLQFEKTLHPASGTIQVPGSHASLRLGEQYYFLPAEDAKRVLVEAWGNPPDSVGDVLGMVFPAGRHFYEGVWGAVLTYDDTGHVDDKDAASEDYDAVLKEMKSGEVEENKARKEAGYEAVQLVGWAQAPTYDARSKTLIWARNIKFEGAEENTLNYDVRKLGRTGVLSMNMVDSMGHLPIVRAAAADLGRTVQFEDGARYADFDASTDHTADYGLAGLVAAGAGVAVAKKAGILAVILLVLKKGFVVVLAAVAGLGAWVKRKFFSGYRDQEQSAFEDVDDAGGKDPSDDQRGPGDGA